MTTKKKIIVAANIEAKKIWNKLVRDKIPDICHAQGLATMTRGLGTDEYIYELKKKLIEETVEFESAEGLDNKIEELADIREVIIALKQVSSDSPEIDQAEKLVELAQAELSLTTSTIEDVRVAKIGTRGSFDKRIYLISTEGAH